MANVCKQDIIRLNAQIHGVDNAILESVNLAMEDFDLSLPEREQDETDDEYEITCLDARHNVEAGVVVCAKELLIKSGYFNQAAGLVKKDIEKGFYDDLLCEIAWNKLSNLKN